MIRHSTRVRFLTGGLALAGALILVLVLSGIMQDQRCRDTGGHFNHETRACIR